MFIYSVTHLFVWNNIAEAKGIIIILAEMNVDSLSKNSLHLREIKKIFQPESIDTKLILEAFKAQQVRKIMASSRSHQFTPSKKKEDEAAFLLLHVNGKECSQQPEFWSTRIGKDFKSANVHQIHNVKLALKRPLNKLIEQLEKDPEHHLFEGELASLKNYNQQRQKMSFSRYADYNSKTGSPNPGRSNSLSTTFQRSSFYEGVVMSNSALTRKVIMIDRKIRSDQSTQMIKTGTTGQRWKKLPALKRQQRLQKSNECDYF